MIRGGGGSIKSNNEILTYHALDYDTLSDYEKQEGYIFHIFTQNLSKDSNTKDQSLESNLQILQDDLNKIYPCSIKVHYINDSLFENCEKWVGAYAVYYRLRITNEVDSNIKYVLSLECDMLVNADIRGLFTIDMESKFAYVVHDYFFHTQKIIQHKYNKDKFLNYDKHYFNAGFIFFNLESCRNINIWEQAKQLFKDYQMDFAEQDVFNYILKGNVGILSPCFNYMSFAFGNYPIRITKDENQQNCDMYYTRKQLECGLENVVVYHYTPYKPWSPPIDSKYPSRYNYAKVLKAIHLWEKFAKITPVYSGEIQNVLDSIKENEFDNYTIFIAKKLENIESNSKKDLENLAKKIRKRMKILIISQISLFTIMILLIFKM
ncbi:hypothetical protein DCO60_06510 [Helicobacter saguini]|nr:hypothetical protein [Helicobacter saguini]